MTVGWVIKGAGMEPALRWPLLSGKACWDVPEYRSLGSAAEPEQSLASTTILLHYYACDQWMDISHQIIAPLYFK